MNSRLALATQVSDAVTQLACTDLIAHQVQVMAGSSCLLHDVNVCLKPGQVAAILGPNGAGKSTLLWVLAGLRVPQHGDVQLDGQALQTYPPQGLAGRRALLAQDTSVAFDFLAHEVVELGRYPHRLKPSAHESSIVEEAMRLTDTWHLRDRRVAWLSGGERLRLQLARVLAQIWEPPSDGASRWLLLDEPTASLDLHHQHQVLETARDWAHQRGVGVVTVLHDLNLALRYTDQAWVLVNGRVVAQGWTDEVLTEHLLCDVWRMKSQRVNNSSGQAQLIFGEHVFTN